MDDDNYVNPESLLHLLSTFSSNQDVYLGRPSLDHPIEATERVQGGGAVSAGASILPEVDVTNAVGAETGLRQAWAGWTGSRPLELANQA